MYLITRCDNVSGLFSSISYRTVLVFVKPVDLKLGIMAVATLL